MYLSPLWFQAMFNHHASNNLSLESSGIKVSETAGSMNTIRMGYNLFGSNLRLTKTHKCTCPSWDKRDYKSTVALTLSRTSVLLTFWTVEVFSSSFRLFTKNSIAAMDLEPVKGDGGSGPLQIQLLSEAWICFTDLFQILLWYVVC